MNKRLTDLKNRIQKLESKPANGRAFASALAEAKAEHARLVTRGATSARADHSRAADDAGERARLRADMDQRMGLTSNAGRVERSRHSLSFSVFGDDGSSPKPAPRGGGALLRRPPAQARPVAQPPASSASAEAADMDVRMGTAAPRAASVKRSAHELVFNVGR